MEVYFHSMTTQRNVKRQGKEGKQANKTSFCLK